MLRSNFVEYGQTRHRRDRGGWFSAVPAVRVACYYESRSRSSHGFRFGGASGGAGSAAIAAVRSPKSA